MHIQGVFVDVNYFVVFEIFITGYGMESFITYWFSKLLLMLFDLTWLKTEIFNSSRQRSYFNPVTPRFTTVHLVSPQFPKGHSNTNNTLKYGRTTRKCGRTAPNISKELINVQCSSRWGAVGGRDHVASFTYALRAPEVAKIGAPTKRFHTDYSNVILFAV